MQSYYRFRLKRTIRSWRRAVKFMRRQLAFLSNIYVFNRTRRLRRVQRFIFSTVAVLVIALGGLWWQLGQLKQYYLVDGGRSGGTFIEGAIGPLTRVNPLFPDEPAAEAVSKLVFSGLLRYNGQGKLVPDLARSWSHNSLGTVYTVKLRSGLLWHDGKPLTADDVVFTINTIKNPDAHSPLAPSWKGIQVTAPTKGTIQFQLPGPYSPFPGSLTQAIVPKHLLVGIEISQLRLADFNQHPVGSGPFVFDEFIPNQHIVRLHANPTYTYGPPQLRQFIIHTYDDQESLQSAFANHQLTAASGFGVFDAEHFANVSHTHLYEWPTTNQAFVFFNNARSILANRAVRQALTRSTQLALAADKFNYHFRTANGPLLPEQLGYSRKFTQLQFDLKIAKAQLQKAGWKLAQDGWRYKKRRKLALNLVTQDRDIYPVLAQVLQEQWKKVGVDLRLRLANSNDLESQYIQPRKYDVLLYGIVLGADPDVYSYWHSSQVEDPGLNLSLYRSAIADVALETGRTRLEPVLRADKYKEFMKQWQQDAPAIAIYRPSFLYAVQDRVHGIDVHNLINASDRFYNVRDWTVNTTPKLKRLMR